jgi:hypothetical protein
MSVVQIKFRNLRRSPIRFGQKTMRFKVRKFDPVIFLEQIFQVIDQVCGDINDGKFKSIQNYS